MDASSVPKFASFKLKKEDSEKPEKPDRTERTEKSGIKHRHASSSRHRIKHRRESDKEAVRSEPSRSQQEKLPSRHYQKDLSIKFEDREWVSDRRGDPLIETYRSLHKYDIPRFSRIGYGRVLGTKNEFKINRAISDEKKIVLDASDKYDLPGRSVLVADGKKITNRPRVLKKVENSSDKVIQSAYIPIRSTRNIESVNAHGPDLALDQNDSIGLDSDGETELETELDSLDETDLQIQSKNSELIAATKSEPNNLQHWLDLIEHQDRMILLGQTKDFSLLGSKAIRNLSDIKLSIYQRALRNFPTDFKSLQTLYSGLLNVGEQIWGTQELNEQWQIVLSSMPQNIDLHMGYLNLIQANSVLYEFKVIKEKFLECIQITAHSFRKSNEKSFAICQVYLFLRFTVFLKQTGYHELAIALWQAIMDYIIMRPNDIDDSDSITLFGEYWDSECARLGEGQIRAWEVFRNGSTVYPENKSVKPKTDVVPETLPPFQTLIKEEFESERFWMQPGRISSMEDNDDPLHTVIFSDILAILEKMLYAKEMTEPLIWAFLKFTDLPPLEQTEDNYEYNKWWSDPFLVYESNHHLEARSNRTDENGYHSSLRMSLGITTYDLFSGIFPKHLMMEFDFIQNVLKELVQNQSPWDQLAEYYIAFHSAYSTVAETRKECKNLLSQRKNSIRLYNAYALVEKRETSSEKICLTVLNMFKGSANTAHLELVLILRTLFFDQLGMGRLETAKHTLISSTIDSVTAQNEVAIACDHVTILKVQQVFRRRQNECLANHKIVEAVAYLELLSWFEYLRHGRNLDTGFSVFSQAKQLIQSNAITGYYRELVDQAQVGILEYHVRSKLPYRPSGVKSFLSESAKLFPDNSKIQRALIDHQRSFGLEDKFRQDRFKVGNESVINWLLQIFSETKRIPELGGTKHGIRAVYQRASASVSSKNSIALWTAFLYFEAERGDLKDLEAVVHQGLLHIPWSKAFAMHSLSFLEKRGALPTIMQRIYQLLEAREFRLHTDMEKFKS